MLARPVPHFFAVHLLQALPLAGWLADRAVLRHAKRWVVATAGAGLLVVFLTFWRAVAGRPFIPL